MRIDKVQNRKISVSYYQRLVNQLYADGCSIDEIIKKSLDWSVNIRNEYNSVTIHIPVIVKPSNLGKGLLAYMQCPSCYRKVRDLYFINKDVSCRLCHGLTYKKDNRHTAEIKRLMFDIELRNRYLNTLNMHKIRKVFEAESAVERLQERGCEIADEMILEGKKVT